MSVQKFNNLFKSSILILVLSSGLVVSACSVEPVDTVSSIEKSDASKQYQLGLSYYEGNSVSQDYNKAFELFQEAANQGDPQAQFQLGSMYEKGQGVSEDKTKAAQWYRQAAEQGLADGQNALAKLYYFNMELEPVFNESIAWFEKAAAQGQPESQYYVGFFYEDGYDRPTDKDQALK